jgi:predicted ATPase/class 3 adenylate cyclase
VHELPSGTVTFLFTDLEGSTRLWEEHPDAMKPALARHDELVRTAIDAHDGSVVKTTGDGFHAAFATAHDAIDAAIDAQRRLAGEQWDGTGPLRVRMGLHTCEAEVRDGDYYGSGVNRAARLMSVAHGGQIVVSAVTGELVRDTTIELVDLGEHRLRDLTNSERIFEVQAPGLATKFPPLLSLDAFPGNLPARQTSFVGRFDELDKIADALRASPMVTLTGVGGVGKTRLALQVAAQVLPQYPDGAWLSELAAANDPESLIEIVASTFGVSVRAGMDLAQSVVEHLRTKRLLLVLDNCEHLLDAAGRLAQAVVETCPQVRVLATSREGLAVDGEQVMPLRSLGIPDRASDAVDVETSDAARLFLDRARSTQADFSLTGRDAEAVAEICRRLDGIPLAIELAAARAVAMNPSEIADLLDERFRLLAGGRRSAVERHQTLRATVDWSYALLDPGERLVFDRLGVFAGSFDVADATAVVSGDGVERFDVVDALTGLVSKSMLTVERTSAGPTRYQLLETLRHYARERLEEAGAVDEWRRRHAHYYAEFAERASPQLMGPEEIAARARVVDAADNLRAAFTWAMDGTDPDDLHIAFRIVDALAMEAAIRRSTGVGAWAARVLERGDLFTEGERAGAKSAMCFDLFQRGELAAAWAMALEVVESGSTPRIESLLQAYQCAATCAAQLGDLDAALTLFAGALDAVPDPSVSQYGIAAVHSVRALSYASHGRFEEAREDAEAALAIARPTKNPTVQSLALQALGWSSWTTEPTVARDAFEESVALMKSGAIEGGLDATRARLAPLRFAAGDVAGSLDLLLETFSHVREIGERLSTVTALDASVGVLTALGEDEPAAVLAGVMRSEMFGPIAMLIGIELQRHQAAHAALRHRLGDDAFQAFVDRGAALDDDDALAYAIAELTRVRAALDTGA